MHHYWTSLYRHIAHNRSYFLINVVGLVIGLTVFMLGFAYVQQELSYDRWIDDADRVYRGRLSRATAVEQRFDLEGVVRLSTADNLEEQIPAIEAIGLIGRGPVRRMRIGQRAEPLQGSPRLVFISPGFLDIYPLNFVAGSRDVLFSDLNSIAVSTSFVQQRMSGMDPFGQSLWINDKEWQIAAVYEDYPRKTHIHTDLIAPIAGVEPQGDIYLRLAESADFQALQDTIERLVVSDTPVGQAGDEEGTFELQPVTSLYLNGPMTGGPFGRGSRSEVTGIAVVSIFVLALTVINFLALALVQSIRRSREASLRKLFGASSGQLVRLYVGQSVLTALFALGVAVLAYLQVQPVFIDYLNGGVSYLDLPPEHRAGLFQVDGSPVNLLRLTAAIAVAVFVGSVAGIYPAVSAARQHPAENFSGAGSATPARDRVIQKSIGIAQRVVAATIVSGLLVVALQSRYAASFDRGFEPRNTVMIAHYQSSPNPAGAGNFERFRAQQVAAAERFALRAIELPGVREAGLFASTPMMFLSGVVGDIAVRNPLDGTDSRAVNLQIGTGYLDIMQTGVLAGHTFSGAGYGFGDAGRGAHEGEVVLTENLALSLGFTSADDAVGRNVDVYLGNGEWRTGPVVGVIANLRPSFRDSSPVPAVFRWMPSVSGIVMLRVDPGIWPELERQLDQILSGVTQSSFPLPMSYSDEWLDWEMRPLLRIQAMFAGGSALALLIAGIGIYGVAGYETERRRREMAIRHVMGAQRMEILKLLVFESGRQTAIAFVIALPIGWYLLNEWLQGFGARIDLTPVPFVAAALIVFLFSLVASGQQFGRLIVARPADSLRYE